MRFRRRHLAGLAAVLVAGGVAVGASDPASRPHDEALRVRIEAPETTSPKPVGRSGDATPEPTAPGETPGITIGSPPTSTTAADRSMPSPTLSDDGSGRTGGLDAAGGTRSAGESALPPIARSDRPDPLPVEVDPLDPDDSTDPTPAGPDPDVPVQPDPATPTEPVVPAIGPEVGPFIQPRGPAPDQLECPQLASVAIGSWDQASADAEVLGAASVRFRTQVQTIQAAADRDRDGAIVCGSGQVHTWRNNLVVQGLVAGGKQFGVLVSGRDPEDPVMWLSQTEWMSWEWHPAGSDGRTDFTGVPVERTTIDGVGVIRTDIGGVVLVHDDTPGVALVGGAWDRWLESGGPNGPMGVPATYPTGKGVGAEQGFTLGMLRLPLVTNPFEAITRPASDYVWTPFTAEPPPLAVPPNSIVKFGTPSYYVDNDGVRHWLETESDWMCARHDLGATEIKGIDGQIDVASLAALPLGEVFVCPSRAVR